MTYLAVVAFWLFALCAEARVTDSAQKAAEPPGSFLEFCPAHPSTTFTTYIRIQATGPELYPDDRKLGTFFWSVIMAEKIAEAYETIAGVACDPCRRRITNVRSQFENDSSGSTCPLSLDYIMYEVTIEQSGHCETAFDLSEEEFDFDDILEYEVYCGTFGFYSPDAQVCCCKDKKVKGGISTQDFLHALQLSLVDSWPFGVLLDLTEYPHSRPYCPGSNNLIEGQLLVCFPSEPGSIELLYRDIFIPTYYDLSIKECSLQRLDRVELQFSITAEDNSYFCQEVKFLFITYISSFTFSPTASPTMTASPTFTPAPSSAPTPLPTWSPTPFLTETPGNFELAPTSPLTMSPTVSPYPTESPIEEAERCEKFYKGKGFVPRPDVIPSDRILCRYFGICNRRLRQGISTEATQPDARRALQEFPTFYGSFGPEWIELDCLCPLTDYDNEPTYLPPQRDVFIDAVNVKLEEANLPPIIAILPSLDGFNPKTKSKSKTYKKKGGRRQSRN